MSHFDEAAGEMNGVKVVLFGVNETCLDMRARRSHRNA